MVDTPVIYIVRTADVTSGLFFDARGVGAEMCT